MAAKLHLRYASMNAGKSTQLLQIAHNYKTIGTGVLLFTFAGGDRSGTVGEISSRLGVSSPAATFDATTDFDKLLGHETREVVLLIDECQFLTGAQVNQLHQLSALKAMTIMCFGLRTDFQGKPFEGTTYLLALAEDIQEIKAICQCGRKSTMNIRIDAQGRRIKHGEQLLIGGNDRYRQVCARCFYAGQS